MAAKHFVLSVLFFQQGDTCIAQALQHDITASGPDVEHAKKAFEQTLAGYIRLAIKYGQQPALSAVPPAPDVFWDIWDRVTEGQHEFPTEKLEKVPKFPAFMMPVVTHEPLPA